MHLSLARRRQLRRNSTDTEACLWSHLRAHRFADFKFRRQHPVGPFILDFFCAARRLAIELDGGQHFAPSAQAYDARHTHFLSIRAASRFCASRATRCSATAKGFFRPSPSPWELRAPLAESTPSPRARLTLISRK